MAPKSKRSMSKGRPVGDPNDPPKHPVGGLVRFSPNKAGTVARGKTDRGSYKITSPQGPDGGHHTVTHRASGLLGKKTVVGSYKTTYDAADAAENHYARQGVKKGVVVDKTTQYKRDAPGSERATTNAAAAAPTKPRGVTATVTDVRPVKPRGATAAVTDVRPATPSSNQFYPPGTKVEHGSIDLSGAKKPPQVAMGKAIKFVRSPGLLHQREATTGHGTYVMTPHDRSGKMQVHYCPNGGEPRKIGSFSGKHTASTAAHQHHDHVAKAAEVALPRPKTQWATGRENMSRMSYGARTSKRQGKPGTAAPHQQNFLQRHRDGIKDLGTTTLTAKTKKAFQVLSLDDYHASVVKAGALGAPVDQPTTPLKKFPRKTKPATDDFADEAPTVTMKPTGATRHQRTGAAVKMRAIGDEEADANLRAGKHKKPGYEKSLMKQLAVLKALATGYGKTSGGGALKAPNRLMFNLERAMEAMPQRSSKTPPRTPAYLPGVHDPAHPARKLKQPRLPGQTLKKDVSIDDIKPDAGRAAATPSRPRAPDGGPPAWGRPGDPPLRTNEGMTTARNKARQSRGEPPLWDRASDKPHVSGVNPKHGFNGHSTTDMARDNVRADRAQAEWIANLKPASKPGFAGAQAGGTLTKKSEIVLHKSSGDHPMAKTNFNDIFKSELNVQNEEALCECPHCDAPITKSDLEKAHQGKGAVTNVSGPKSVKADAHVSKQNNGGGTTRGGDGRGQISPSRPGAGIPKQDPPVGVQNSKGSKAHKAFDDSSSCDASSGDDDKDDKKAPPFAKKDAKKSITIRGTEWVQYVDDGSDAAIAKSIAEQSLTPHSATQPMDRNNDLTRLLI